MPRLFETGYSPAHTVAPKWGRVCGCIRMRASFIVREDIDLETTTKEKICILVLGMHRSGTSALAGLFNRLGVALPEGDLIGASKSNPSGHFEPEEVVRIHDRILSETGSGWSDPRAVASAHMRGLAIWL